MTCFRAVGPLKQPPMAVSKHISRQRLASFPILLFVCALPQISGFLSTNALNPFLSATGARNTLFYSKTRVSSVPLALQMSSDPLLLRAARGETVERSPVWMMRQAGRHMQVGNTATVLGFVGLPYTLATYLVEGGTSKEYLEIKKMMYSTPEILHKMLETLAENIGNYANFQIDCGAQVIQIFDSWAGSLSPEDYDIFAMPYQRIVVDMIKKKHPETPIIIYIAKSGHLLERMAKSGADIVSLDWTVSIDEARARMGTKVGLQGNLDPAVLYAPHHVIKERTEAILKMAGNKHHVMNLGHGIEATTPEESANFFVKTVQAYKH